tara:strand:+ start:951 stop:2087 length:1137 start_codon:yes stop_codon:yes gene_type:complete
MNKLIFKKLASDILFFFIISSISLTIIVWVVQAVNLLEIVSEDGHSLKVYFIYSFLTLPKIFSKIIIFVFFISLFYIINKYEDTNEILVFWSNGIKKINFINFIFRLSIIFLIFQLFLSLIVVPAAQNQGRNYLKNSNIDFFPSLISEKKFISIFKNLTIFIEKYNPGGNLEKVFIKERINSDKSKIISAKKGRIIKKDDKYLLRLFNGGITNIEKKNTYTLNFSETEYDLSKFSSRTVTHPKIQEINSLKLFQCIKKNYLLNNFNIKAVCDAGKGKRPMGQIVEEMFKRLVLPFYIIAIALFASYLVVKPKSLNNFKYHKSTIFLLGFLTIIFSQITFKFISYSKIHDLFVILIPLIIVLMFYIFIGIKTNFKFNTL